jgi:hypothetical protein
MTARAIILAKAAQTLRHAISIHKPQLMTVRAIILHPTQVVPIQSLAITCTANCDDGSCQFYDACGICGGSGTIGGCTDAAAFNFVPGANCDNGSCLYTDACGV